MSAACLFSFTALATEPPQDSWQNSYKPEHKYNHPEPKLNNNHQLTIEHWTILADVEPLEQLGVLAHVVRPDGAQELDVVVAVELGHLVLDTNNIHEYFIYYRIVNNWYTTNCN